MKFKTLLLVLLAPIISFTQTCLPQGIVFSAQSQIDSFPLNFPDCTIVEGDIQIEGNDVIDISGLNQILEIQGDLAITKNPSLIFLDGFDQLKLVFGDIHIESHSSLESITVCDNLESLGSLFIRWNDVLTSLNGFNLIERAGDVQIRINHQLEDVLAFQSLDVVEGFQLRNAESLTDVLFLSELDSVYGELEISSFGGQSLIGLESLVYVEDLDIRSNIYLEELKGIDNLKTVGDDLTIQSNISLRSFNSLNSLDTIYGRAKFGDFNQVSLNGFQNLKHVGESFEFIGARKVSSIEDLSNLNYVGGELNLSGMDSLRTLEGIENVDMEDVSFLTISGNDSLSFCSYWNICNWLETHNNLFYEISGNADSCATASQIIVKCLNVSTDEIPFDEINISPNPTNGLFTIKLDYDTSIEEVQVFNTLGQRVAIERWFEEIDLTSESPGIYYLRIQDENGRVGLSKIILH